MVGKGSVPIACVNGSPEKPIGAKADGAIAVFENHIVKEGLITTISVLSPSEKSGVGRYITIAPPIDGNRSIDPESPVLYEN